MSIVNKDLQKASSLCMSRLKDRMVTKGYSERHHKQPVTLIVMSSLDVRKVLCSYPDRQPSLNITATSKSRDSWRGKHRQTSLEETSLELEGQGKKDRLKLKKRM